MTPETPSGRQRPPISQEIRALGGARVFRGKRVLDVGAGAGRFALALAKVAAETLAIEPDPGAVAMARAAAREAGLSRVRFRVGHAEELREAGYDLALFSWSLC